MFGVASKSREKGYEGQTRRPVGQFKWRALTTVSLPKKSDSSLYAISWLSCAVEIRALAKRRYPVPVKEILAWAEIITAPEVRLPLTPLSDAARPALKKAFEDIASLSK